MINKMTKVFNIEPENIDKYNEDIEVCAKHIRDGGLAVFPTETVYGIGANALDEEAVHSIYICKGRPLDNPFIVHFADKNEIDKYVYTGAVSKKIIDYFMPGPCTIVLKNKNIIPRGSLANLETAAVRIPKNEIARRLIYAAGVPVTAPSANLSGKPSPTKLSHVYDDLYGKVDAMIDGGDCEIGLESTVLSTNETDKITILRPGAVTKSMLEAALPEVKVIYAECEGVDLDRPLSPGMKYKHYAPKAPMYLVYDETGGEKALEYIIKQIEMQSDVKRIGILCFDEYAKAIESVAGEKNCRILSLGAKDFVEEQARRLFDCLNAFNFLEVDVIYSFIPKKEEIGIAVYNRMLKAAEHKVLKA